MFKNIRLPRWIGLIAFGIASLYWVARACILISMYLSDPRPETTIGVLDLGIFIAWSIVGIGLKQTGQSAQRGMEHSNNESQQIIADRMLLADFWQFINWRDLSRIVHQLNSGKCDWDLYLTIPKYLEFRADNNERQIQNPYISQKLISFDDSLVILDQQLISCANLELQGDRQYWIPHYKSSHSRELRDEKSKEYDKAINYAEIVLERHKDLTESIREVLPDFFEDRVITTKTAADKTQSELDASDMATIDRLWKYISYDNIQSLLDGYASNRVPSDLVWKLEEYWNKRQHPDNRLYDQSLEKILMDFDSGLAKTLERGGDVFGPASFGSDYYVAVYRTQRGKPWEDEHYSEYKEFVSQIVKPTFEKYQLLISELKRRRLYHKLIE